MLVGTGMLELLGCLALARQYLDKVQSCGADCRGQRGVRLTSGLSVCQISRCS